MRFDCKSCDISLDTPQQWSPFVENLRRQFSLNNRKNPWIRVFSSIYGDSRIKYLVRSKKWKWQFEDVMGL